MTAGSVVAPQIIPIRKHAQGKAKQEVDTVTPIAIKSDTPDVWIYYTLDGSKPAVVRRPGSGGGSTRKYDGPVLLPEGRVEVKALAVTSDGRESATVTKVFLVELVDSKSRKEDEENQQDLSRQEPCEGTSWSAENSAGGSSREPRLMGRVSHRSPTGPRFLNSRLGPSTPGAQNSSSQRSQTLNLKDLKNLTKTQTTRIHRETDFLRCAQCLRHRPSDPFARFCAQCGALVPPILGQTLPPTEGGQMAWCVHCKNLVPVNTPTCVICEAPISPQLQPQASLKLQDHVVCLSCGSGNPAGMFYCVTCESRLAPPPTADSAPPVPSRDDRMLSCSRCKRLNHCDARYCDWCGSKPGHAASYVMCWRCGATCRPYTNYCGVCGVFLEGPARTDTSRPTGGAPDQDQVSRPPSHDATWQASSSSTPFPGVAVAPPTVERQTQTVGLFYPSTTELHRKEQQRALESNRQEQMRDRWPLLTTISPGRGYWRKQLDHVAAHLRSYSQNNSHFRALIGEPRLGRMVSAVIQEDDYEVSLRINFVSAGREKPKVNGEERSAKPAGRAGTLSSVTEGSAHSISLG